MMSGRIPKPILQCTHTPLWVKSDCQFLWRFASWPGPKGRDMDAMNPHTNSIQTNRDRQIDFRASDTEIAKWNESLGTTEREIVQFPETWAIGWEVLKETKQVLFLWWRTVIGHPSCPLPLIPAYTQLPSVCWCWGSHPPVCFSSTIVHSLCANIQSTNSHLGGVSLSLLFYLYFSSSLRVNVCAGLCTRPCRLHVLWEYVTDSGNNYIYVLFPRWLTQVCRKASFNKLSSLPLSFLFSFYLHFNLFIKIFRLVSMSKCASAICYIFAAVGVNMFHT